MILSIFYKNILPFLSRCGFLDILYVVYFRPKRSHKYGSFETKREQSAHLVLQTVTDCLPFKLLYNDYIDAYTKLSYATSILSRV